MNMVDSVHGRVYADEIPALDAKAYREGRPTTPIFQAQLRSKQNQQKSGVFAKVLSILKKK